VIRKKYYRLIFLCACFGILLLFIGYLIFPAVRKGSTVVVWFTRNAQAGDEFLAAKIEDQESIERLRVALNKDFRRPDLRINVYTGMLADERIIFCFDDDQAFVCYVLGQKYLVYDSAQRYYVQRTLTALNNIRSEGKVTTIGPDEVTKLLPESHRHLAKNTTPIQND